MMMNKTEAKMERNYDEFERGYNSKPNMYLGQDCSKLEKTRIEVNKVKEDRIGKGGYHIQIESLSLWLNPEQMETLYDLMDKLLHTSDREDLEMEIEYLKDEVTDLNAKLEQAIEQIWPRQYRGEI